MLGPALVTFLSTVYRLGSVSLWRDEAYSIEAARRSFGQIFALLNNTDAVNGAYYLLLHVAVSLGGVSATVVRLPSVLAMTVAAGVTAATGRRLALLAALPAPALTGAAAGLFVAAAPEITMYAQEARAYALVTMMATIASYLLLRAVTGRGWGWWGGYSLAIIGTGLFNVLGLLLVPAHAMTMLIIKARRPVPGAPAATARLLRWLAASAAAGLVLSPLLVTGYEQRGQISWLGRPTPHDAVLLAQSFAGSKLLLAFVGVVALAGLAAGLIPRPAVQVPPAALTVPWLILPPLVLLAVSQVTPMYDGRYVLYCLPALALLFAAGLSWLARVTELVAGSRLGVGPGAAWLPALLAGVAVAALLVAPQQAVRSAWAWPDNLRRGSAIVAANERPGDAVFYLPPNMRSLSLGYPAPYRRLRDVTQARSPLAAHNLIGTTVSAAVLQHRMAGVSRVWVVTGSANHRLPSPGTRLEKTELALLSRWRMIHRWTAGYVGLRLYVRPRRR